MILAAVLPDGLNLDLGMGLFPQRHDHIQELCLLAVAVCMPERNGDFLGGLLRVAAVRGSRTVITAVDGGVRNAVAAAACNAHRQHCNCKEHGSEF